MVFNRCCQLASPSSPLFPNCQRQLDSAHAPHTSRALAIAHALSQLVCTLTRARANELAHALAHNCPKHAQLTQLGSATTVVSSARAAPPRPRTRHTTCATHSSTCARTTLAHRAPCLRTARTRCAALLAQRAARASTQLLAALRKRVRATCTMGHTRATHYRAALHGSPCATPTPRTTRARSFLLRTQ
jgi:hypothetical protein